MDYHYRSSLERPSENRSFCQQKLGTSLVAEVAKGWDLAVDLENPLRQMYLVYLGARKIV